MNGQKKKLSADEYSSIFGDPEEAGDSKTALNITVSAECKAILARMRENTGKSMSQIVEELVLNSK